MPSNAISRLCPACGLCCNGVLFHSVRLQPGDSPKELQALGIKLKRKKGEYSILHPCPAHRATSCAIYENRPERCRRFECRLLQKVASGEMESDAALEKIREAQRTIEMLNTLFAQTGIADNKKTLVKRLEQLQADPTEVALRQTIIQAMEDLETLLSEEFRIASK